MQYRRNWSASSQRFFVWSSTHERYSKPGRRSLLAGSPRRCTVVCTWISSTLPGHPTVTGPTWVLDVKEWGVIARFAIDSTETQLKHDEDIVFKASYISLFQHTPFVYELLNHCCSGSVPQFLAWDAAPGRMWTLFRPFEGDRVRDIKRLEPLLEVARTIARIQVAVADMPTVAKQRIDQLPVRRLPTLFDEILQDIRETHLSVWNADDGAIAHACNLPPDPLERLLRFREQVQVWATELDQGGWPTTIDHTDLHAGNAALQADGHVLIYDWEEATIGSPFFSLEQLLIDARTLEPEHVPGQEQRGDESGETQSERAICEAYLDALPWKTYVERKRALELAGYLWPIKFAYICKEFTLALGRHTSFSRHTAILMAQALQLWESI